MDTAQPSPRLRPYHNPENVDESRVPAGWRFLYDGESLRGKRMSRVWMISSFSMSTDHFYWSERYTYIVPVA